MPVCAPLPLATALRVLAAMKSISADCGWRSIAGEGRGFTRKQPVGQISVQPRSEKYFASPFGRNSFIDSNHPTPQEGRIMIVTDAGRDAVDAAALGAQRGCRADPTRACERSNGELTNDVAAYGEVVWS